MTEILIRTKEDRVHIHLIDPGDIIGYGKPHSLSYMKVERIIGTKKKTFYGDGLFFLGGNGYAFDGGHPTVQYNQIKKIIKNYHEKNIQSSR